MVELHIKNKDDRLYVAKILSYSGYKTSILNEIVNSMTPESGIEVRGGGEDCKKIIKYLLLNGYVVSNNNYKIDYELLELIK